MDHSSPYRSVYPDQQRQPSRSNHVQPLRRSFFNWTRSESLEDEQALLRSKKIKDEDSHVVGLRRNEDLRKSDPSSSTTPGLFGKLKQLTKLYGSAALVIYGLLGAVDFGLAFLTIYLVGEDQVRIVEDWLLAQLNWKRATNNQSLESSISNPDSKTLDNNNNNNMLWTTAVVAYTIHKTILLPVRLGLTAWITPPIVRVLRKRGWKLGRNLE